jgi:N6-L-threonylcarbamoyladenine synthase
MVVLGIETSCDETAAAVVADGVILSNVVASQHELHREYAGVVPEIASRAHVEAILPVVREALAVAGVGLGRVDAIAVGNRPGLIGSLLVGVAAAKALAWSLGKPIIGVDHVRAHLYAGLLRPEHAPEPDRRAQLPALGLVVSGGHTALYAVRAWNDIPRLGSTIDDAMGEAFDKVAAILGLPHPGGPNVDQLARETGANDRAHAFPISRLAKDSLDFSFSGLKTAVLYATLGVPVGGVFPRGSGAISHREKRDIAASFQRAACEAVVMKVERALARERFGTLLCGGGVTANRRLRNELRSLCAKRKTPVVLPAMELCMDNAAMIAGLGAELLRAGERSAMDLQAVPTTG